MVRNVKFAWASPTLNVHHGDMALFLAWNDDTGEILFMSSDELEWAWSTLEYVGTVPVGNYPIPGDAATALWDFAARLEAGDLAVTRSSTPDDVIVRDMRQWTGTTWDDPLDPSAGEGPGYFERWQGRRLALGSLSDTEIADLVASL